MNTAEFAAVGRAGEHPAPRGLRWSLLLVFLFVLPCLFGSVSGVLALLMGASFLPLAFTRRNLAEAFANPMLRLWTGAFLLLLIAFSITATTPADIRYAANFLPLLIAVPVYLAARRRAGARALAELAVLCLCGAVIAAAISAWDIFVSRSDRATGYFSGPNLMARVALLLGFASLAGLLGPPSRWKLLLYLGPLCAAFAAILTGSRGAFIGTAGMLPVFGIFLLADRRLRLHGILLLVLGAAGLLGLATLEEGRWLQRFAALPGIVETVLRGEWSGLDMSVLARIELVIAGWNAFLEAPLLGHGWANFIAAATPWFDVSRIGVEYFMFHNDLVNFAVAAGAVGVVCWAAILTAPLFGALHGPRDGLFRPRLYVGLLLTVGFALYGLTDLTLGYDLTTILFAFLGAIANGALRDPQVAASASPA